MRPVGSLFKKPEPEAPPRPEYDGHPVRDLGVLGVKAFKLQCPFTQRIADICQVNEFPISDDQRALVDLEFTCLNWVALIAHDYYNHMPQGRLEGAMTEALEKLLKGLEKEFWTSWLKRGAAWAAKHRGEADLEERWESLECPFSLPRTQGRDRLFVFQVLLRMHTSFQAIYKESYLHQEKINGCVNPLMERAFDLENQPFEVADILQAMVEPLFQKVLEERLPHDD